MASTYTTDLAIQLMATGENAGTWGAVTNTNLVVIQQAIAGYQDISIAGGAQTTALVMTQNALANARNAVIKLSGTISGNQIVTVPTGIEKTWIVSNGTVGAYTVQFKYASGGSGQTWSTTDKGIKILYSDGSDIQVTDLSTLSGQIVAAQITNSTITQAKLASNSIGTAQLQTNAVTAVKITQSTITQSKLAANSVGSNQLISTGVTAASYTTANITVDADGRITSASSGTSGGGGFVLASVVAGPASGTYTASPTATKIQFFLRAGGGGGSGGRRAPNNAPWCGGNRGAMGTWGGFGLFEKTITQPYAVPYSLGARGTGGAGGYNSGSAGNAGTGSTFDTNFTATGGGGGSGFGPTTILYASPYTSSTGLLNTIQAPQAVFQQTSLEYARFKQTALSPALQAVVGGNTEDADVTTAMAQNANGTVDANQTASSQGGVSSSGNSDANPGNPGYQGLLVVFENLGQ
jgi:hypothetical protein